MMDISTTQKILDEELETMVDYAISIGSEEWVKESEILMASTNEGKAKCLIKTMCLLIMFRVVDKCKQLGELE